MKAAPLFLAVALFAWSSSDLLAQRPPGGRRPGDLRTESRLRVGDTAPDFKLQTMEGDRAVELSSFKGKRPVVLVFGSYT
jgi:hypothetical protein